MEKDLYSIALKLLLSLAIGILFGIERDMKRLRNQPREGEATHFGGIRTFALIGLLGGLFGYLGKLLSHPVYIYGFIAVMIFVGIGYAVEHRRGGKLGMTTEFSALLVYTLGALCVLGKIEIVIAITIISLLLLSQKGPIQNWTSQLKPVELLASLKFALVLLVILPFLKGIPAVTWKGLYIIDFYQIWKMVVLISTISYFGYFLARFFGREGGVLLSGLLGGLASSTACTQAFASRDRENKDRHLTVFLVAATLLANAMSFIRNLVIVMIINISLFPLLLLPIAVMTLFCAAPAFYLLIQDRHSNRRVKTEIVFESPFSLKPALLFGFLYAVIIFLVQFVKGYGGIGLYLLSFISGLPDTDAITVTLAGAARSAIEPSAGVLALVLALGSNLIFKSFIARSGSRFFWRWVVYSLGAAFVGGLTAAAILLRL
jgi:uncharacterized membrane protein (DUF4010 family)